jgi:hypothetical protein
MRGVIIQYADTRVEGCGLDKLFAEFLKILFALSSEHLT